LFITASVWASALHRFGEQRLRLVVAPLGVVGEGQVAEAPAGVEVVVAEDPPPRLQHAAVQRLGLGVAPAVVVDVGEGVHRLQGLGVLLAEEAAAHVVRDAQVLLGVLVEAEGVVGTSDGDAQPGLDRRPSHEGGAELAGSRIEHLAHGGVAAGTDRIDGRQHVGEELGHRLRLGERHLLVVALAGRAARLHRHGDGEGDEKQEHGGGGRDAAAVAAGELAHPVDGGRWPRLDRHVRVVPAEVRRQLLRRAVAPIAVLLQRLHDDPVEVAVELAHQAVNLAAPQGGDLGGVVHLAHPRARPRRLLVADHAPQVLASFAA
jgi:hypothetical protein